MKRQSTEWAKLQIIYLISDFSQNIERTHNNKKKKLEKAFGKVQHPFMIKKKSPESGHRGNIPQYNKGYI